MKQIVLCCDGTNNTLTAGEADTNVVHLYHHINAHTPPGAQRVLYYDPGVGTPDMLPPTDMFDWGSRLAHRISGLATGRGVYENIEQAYLFIMRQYQGMEDQVYLFGFSRGAFTARAIAGMVNLFGVLRPEHEALVPTLVRIYFSPPQSRTTFWQQVARRLHQGAARTPKKASVEIGGHPERSGDTRERLAQYVNENFTSPAGRQAWVHWVGVWDTVESVGLPGPLARKNPSTATLRGKRIRNVRHALSLDEHRWSFLPRLYDVPHDLPDAAPAPAAATQPEPAAARLAVQPSPDGAQTFQQRWYPGVHCDAGGSYPEGESGISDAALKWMVDEVAAALQIPPYPASPAGFVRHDPLWDTPWWALAGMTVRDMRPLTGSRPHEPIAVTPAELPVTQLGTVWSAGRPLWPLALAVLLGFVFLVLSGAALLEPGTRDFRGDFWSTVALCVDSASDFALRQFASLWGQGLVRVDEAPWDTTAHPGWAMFWDLLFIACWGYLVARVASRAFHWLVGDTVPGQRAPAVRWLGLAPLAAVGGDVSENVLTLLAVGAHHAGTDILGLVLLWLASGGALLKWAGLVACLPLLVVRIWMLLRPEPAIIPPSSPAAGAP